MIDVI